jgi:hypothetical protein
MTKLAFALQTCECILLWTCPALAGGRLNAISKIFNNSMLQRSVIAIDFVASWGAHHRKIWGN